MNSGKLKQIFSSKLKFSRPALAGILGIFVLALLLPMPVHANIITDALMNLLAGLLLLLAQGVGLIANALIGILIQIVQYNGFIKAEAVVKGWVVVRDVVNMFFIVILLAIAFGTVFRVEEYQYKKLLSKLLIMAVLVNFSKSIAGFFIDFAQVVMITFVNGFKDAAAGNFINGFRIKEMFEFAKLDSNPKELQVTSSDFFFAAALALITMTIATIVVGVYVVVFTLRIVILWLLIIISPIAYILQAFPGDAKKYASQWWDYFGKYVSSGPILAFFLWLSLAVMQMSGGSTGSTLTGVSSTNLGLPAAGITGIGQSEILLSFIISIMMLLGGLWMTQQLGVAGGKLAGSAMSAIQKGGMAPFKLAGKGVGLAGKGIKGLVKWGGEEAGARLGIETSLEKWKAGWAAGKHKREQRREDIKLARYEKNRQGRKARQFLGSPEHFFEEIWNFKTVGNMAKAGVGGVTGKKFDEVEGQVHEVEQQIKEKEELLGPNKADEYRGQIKQDVDSINKEAVNQTKEINSINSEADEAIKPKQEEKNNIEKEEVKLRAEAQVFDQDATDEEAEEVKLRAEAKNIAATDPKAAAEKIVQADKKNKAVKELSRKRDDKLIQANDKHNRADKIGKDINKINNERNTKVGERRANIINLATQSRRLQAEAKRTDAELEIEYTDLLKKHALDKQTEAGNLQSGGLTDEQKKGRDKEFDKLTKSLDELRRQIATKTTQGLDVTADNAHINELQAQMAKVKDPVTGAYTTATTEEKKANQKIVEKLLKDAAELTKKADRPIQSVADKERTRSEINKLKDKKVELENIAHRYKPAEDYGVRREQRERINKEKSTMTTDNWQELVQIAKDAIHSGDSSRAAAAYFKATEFGNENEFQNSFACDSGAQGLKQFVEKVFVGQLGLSNQQALAIGSDVSYAAEKVRHWNVARAVTTVKGKLVWANEEDRQKECTAEIRKIDPEGFMRNANRLALFNEKVGGPGLSADASDQEKMEYFEKTGNRYSEPTAMAVSFLVENRNKFKRLLEQGRFNDSIAINIAMEDNYDSILNTVRKSNVLQGDELKEFEKTLSDIKKYAGERGHADQFLNIKKIMGVMPS